MGGGGSGGSSGGGIPDFITKTFAALYIEGLPHLKKENGPFCMRDHANTHNALVHYSNSLTMIFFRSCNDLYLMKSKV